MAGPQEFDSFLRKFVNLWQSDFHAKLYVETEAGNAFVNLQLALGQAQPAHGGGHQAVGGSRQRRRERRAEERQANAVAEEAAAEKDAEDASVAKAAEEAANARAAEEADDARAAEEAAATAKDAGDVKAIEETSDEAVEVSPIPQLDGAARSDSAVFEFTFEAHETCTDDDIIENLKTNFHCPLDDRGIEKDDPIRHFKIKKTSDIFDERKVFEVSTKEDKTATDLVESWKIFGNFDDRAFMNSVHWDITIKIKELQRLV